MTKRTIIQEIIYYKKKFGEMRADEGAKLEVLELSDLFDIRDKWQHVAIVRGKADQ